MSRRQKIAANSPYATGFTDTRDFATADGDTLPGADFANVIDDLQALANRISALPTFAVEVGITSGAFPIANVNILTNGTKPGYANGRVEWVRIGNLVIARIKAICGITGATTFQLNAPWLYSQGLPQPKPITLSPVSDYPSAIVPSAQIRDNTFGWMYPSAAIFEPNDAGALEINRATSGNITEVHAELVYIADGVSAAGDQQELRTTNGTISKRYTFVRAGSVTSLTIPDAPTGTRFDVSNHAETAFEIVTDNGDPIGNEESPQSPSAIIYPGESLSLYYDGQIWRIL